MGVLFIAAMFVDRSTVEWRVDALMERAGKGGPIVAGAAFSIAWTPCVGPALGGILTLAGVNGEPAHGAFLLAVYSLGLAVPFLLTAIAYLACDVGVRHRQAPLPRHHRRPAARS